MSPAKRSKDQDLIDRLAGQIRAPEAKAAKTNGRGRPASPPEGVVGPDDDAVIEKCRSAKSAPKFSDLFDHGDVHAHHGGDDSAADLGLLGMLKFYTQDPDQLERLVSRSALGQREKWRTRADYREGTVRKALADLGKVYNWGHQKGRPLDPREYNHHRTPLGYPEDDYIKNGTPKPSDIVWFHKLGKPKPRKFVIEKVARKGYPLVVYGAGGVAKSFAVLAGGIAIAGGLKKWLGLEVLEHGHVLYLDFELDEDEQLTRVHELCKGMGIDVPEKLAYLSGRGMDRAEAFRQAHVFAEAHKAVAVVVDSVGQAVTGDMDKNKDVNAFYQNHIEPFSRYGTTPILVDHEGKRQQGEKHKDKSVIGGIYKTNNARGVLQFILEEYDKEAHKLDIRVRVPKINFEPPEPFGISITFEGGQVSIETRILPDEELLDEEREPLVKRVYAALATEPLSVIDLARITSSAEGSVRNALSRLTRPGEAGGVLSTAARPKLYYRAEGPRPAGADEYNHQAPLGVSGDDYIGEKGAATVADLFAKPPGWLPRQLKKYREDPVRHLPPLCAAVAAVVLGDGARGPEVREEVEEALEGGGGKKG